MLLSCFTGLAFTDVKNLKKEHLVQADNGEWWIRKVREKTDNMCDIPLLDIPRLILEKYQSNPICNEKGLLLPVPSNQRMNSYLKEIADVCGIQKNLSTHIAIKKSPRQGIPSFRSYYNIKTVFSSYIIKSVSFQIHIF